MVVKQRGGWEGGSGLFSCDDGSLSLLFRIFLFFPSGECVRQHQIREMGSRFETTSTFAPRGESATASDSYLNLFGVGAVAAPRAAGFASEWRWPGIPLAEIKSF